MSDTALEKLAGEAGLLVRWTDASGRQQRVRPDTLRAVLQALQLQAGSPLEIAASRAEIRQKRADTPPLTIMTSGENLRIPGCRRAEIVLDNAERIPLTMRAGGARKRPNLPPGYYTLDCDGEMRRLAVTPKRCLRPGDVAPGRQLSGISVQIYSLRGGATGAFGDFAALGRFSNEAGRLGFDAVMSSPVHALFGAEPGRFTPYSPSTRLFLNPLFADTNIAGVPAAENNESAEQLIDWQRAGPAKFSQLRHTFEHFQTRGNRHAFDSFCRKGGERLLAHALFEALDAGFRGKGIAGFRDWPRGFESPRTSDVRDFVRKARREVEYQLFLQWIAAESAARAQKSARNRMAIGIIADIAVGMDPQGSHAWSAPNELLRNLHVGAPPDIFNSRGQDWGLTTLSPRALELAGFDSYIATLRAGLRHAGGVRIDHAMGLRRLWVIPEGASPAEGVYLGYPERELLSLLALESYLNCAIVIGEDLGTVPEGFRSDIAAKGILGMQVLWFERNSKEQFRPPSSWRSDAVAMTTTHDLPTVAGWWSGHDIALQEQLGRESDELEKLRTARQRDRAKLWSAFTRARCAGNGSPAPEATEPAVTAALRFVARTRSPLAFAPIDDIVAVRDQPNLPGTIDEHPNWRRRLKQKSVLQEKSSRARARAFLNARRSTRRST